MASSGLSKTPLFVRKQAGGMFSVVNETLTTGNIFYVYATTGSDSVGYGRNPDAPFATIDYAIGQCTASQGDMIFVMPGHAETVTAAISVDVAGISIIGLGNGDNRPFLTLTASAAPCFNVRADDIKISNISFYCATSGTSYLKNLMRIAANDILVSNCEFKINQVMTHTVRVKSGDKITIKDCVFLNVYSPGAGAAGIKAQNAVLNVGASNLVIEGCRFSDIAADKAHRWKACVEGGALTAGTDSGAIGTLVKSCQFVCRGIATRTRTAAASGFMATVDCRGISPSSNTSTGAIFTPTYQYCIETYDVAAVNKVGVVTVTTASDRTLKTQITYL